MLRLDQLILLDSIQSHRCFLWVSCDSVTLQRNNVSCFYRTSTARQIWNTPILVAGNSWHLVLNEGWTAICSLSTFSHHICLLLGVLGFNLFTTAGCLDQIFLICYIEVEVFARGLDFLLLLLIQIADVIIFFILSICLKNWPKIVISNEIFWNERVKLTCLVIVSNICGLSVRPALLGIIKQYVL